MKKLWIALLVTLATFSLAQQECAALLTAQSPISFSSIEQSITTNTTLAGGTTVDIYQILDIGGRRLYQETTIPGMGAVIFRFADGNASMQMDGVDMTLPVPDMLLVQLEASFDQVFDQVNVVPSDYNIISCDGPQSYGPGLVSGEQVTISGTLPGMGNQDIKLLFADNTPVGTIATVPQIGTILSVIDQQNKDANGIPAITVVNVYQLDGSATELISTTTVTTLSYNQPVSDDLF